MTTAPYTPGRVRANAFTVDVEEWFHICGAGPALGPPAWDALPSRVVSTTRMVLDELDAVGARATFFVLGWIAERHPGLVEEIRRAGHEIGSHGHLHERAYDLGPTRFLADFRRGAAALTAAGAGPVTVYRAPEWSINDRSLWALGLLAREGVRLDASMAPLRIVGSVGYPRVPHVTQTDAGALLECPPLVADRFGQVMPLGWGWGLRMTRPARTLRAIDRANQRGAPTVIMVHPWEIDPRPPRVSLPARLRFSHYFCLSGFRERLRVVLRGAEFGALSDLAAARAAWPAADVDRTAEPTAPRRAVR